MGSLNILGSAIVAGVTISVLSESLKQVKNAQKDDIKEQPKKQNTENRGHLFQW